LQRYGKVLLKQGMRAMVQHLLCLP